MRRPINWIAVGISLMFLIGGSGPDARSNPGLLLAPGTGAGIELASTYESQDESQIFGWLPAEDAVKSTIPELYYIRGDGLWPPLARILKPD